jgi:hypothetical protein
MHCICRDREEWLSAALFPGKTDRTQNVSYETQAEALRQILGDLDMVFSKLTHIFRVGGARHLDSAGMDDTVSCEVFDCAATYIRLFDFLLTAPSSRSWYRGTPGGT